MPHLGDFVDLLSLLNSSVNFVLYSTMSVLFRTEFIRTFGFCCPQPIRKWHSKRKLKSNGGSIRGPTSAAQTPTRRNRPGIGMTTTEQTERLIINGDTTNSCWIDIPACLYRELTWNGLIKRKHQSIYYREEQQNCNLWASETIH
jgi:hypothetical protein